MSSPKILTGAGVKLLINNKVVGFATGITITREQGVRPIYGIDDPTPQEIAITGPYKVDGSLTGLYLSEITNPNMAGIINAATLQQYFDQKYCTIQIVNRKNGIIMAKIENVVFHSDSWRLEARAISTFSANFIGKFLQVVNPNT
jgi:hypothetical protein